MTSGLSLHEESDSLGVTYTGNSLMIPEVTKEVYLVHGLS